MKTTTPISKILDDQLRANGWTLKGRCLELDLDYMRIYRGAMRANCTESLLRELADCSGLSFVDFMGRKEALNGAVKNPDEAG